MVLATIVTSLALYLGLDSDADPEMLDVMGSGDIAENDADEKVAEETAKETQPKIGTPVQAPPPVRKTKKVAEDWDASEDAMVAEENFLKSGGANGTGATDDEEYDKLVNVYKSFRKLKTDFDEKFRAIWA